jgi:hypothetical protein
MTKDDVAKMVKVLRGLYPASPYILDEQLVITTWRVSHELLRHETTNLPKLYKEVMNRHKAFPSLPEVLAILKSIEKGPMQKPELVDMTIYVTAGYGPTMYAGYVEGIQELNDMRAKRNFPYMVNPLSYEDFMQRHAPNAK